MLKIIVRGGGDLATGVIHRLWGAGFKVLVLECAKPAAIRRQVALCEAVYQGSAQVEGLTARLINSLAEADAVWEHDEVPVLVDEAADSVHAFAPDIVIDAIIAKRNLGTSSTMAPLVIALGPGFSVGADADVIVERSAVITWDALSATPVLHLTAACPVISQAIARSVCCTHLRRCSVRCS